MRGLSAYPSSPGCHEGSSKTGREESEERRLPGHSVIVPGSAPYCFINKAAMVSSLLFFYKNGGRVTNSVSLSE